MTGDLTKGGKVIGTAAYLSPEQARGQPAGVASDLYSAGVVLFELLSGGKPFDAEEMPAILEMHQSKPPPRLSDVAPAGQLSEAMERLVSRALNKAPKDRFSTAQEFVAALDATPEASLPLLRFYGRSPGGSTGTTATRPPVGATGRGRRRYRLWLPGLGVLLALAALAGVGWAWLRHQPDSGADTGGRAVWPSATAQRAAASTDIASEGGGRASRRAAAREPGAPPLMPDASASVADSAVFPAPDAHPAAADAASLGGTPDASAPVTAETNQPRPPGEVRRLADVKRLLRQGKREAAIEGLRRLTRKLPDYGHVYYLLGQQYFEKRWWSEGLKAYGKALKRDPSLARRRTLNTDIITALSDRRTAGRAQALVLRRMGQAALPHLRRAARHHSSRQVRARANWLIRQLLARR
jgi:hypothetical protein